MEKKKYKKLVDSYCPKENVLLNTVKSFFIGGIMGLIGQLLITLYTNIFDISTSSAAPYMSITLIIVASILTALGFFDKVVNWANAGIIIPITGFAHAMTSAAMEYRKEGLILGMGSNIFKLTGSVKLYGVVAAYIFGLLRFLIFGG